MKSQTHEQDKTLFKRFCPKEYHLGASEKEGDGETKPTQIFPTYSPVFPK